MTWLNNLLNTVAWWVKLVIMTCSSFIATLLPMPIPIADVSFVAVLQSFHSIWWYIIVTVIIASLDTGFAVITYKLGHRLTGRFVRSEKNKQKLERMKSKIENNKWADAWVFLSGATPIPFTLTIYATSILEYEMKKFIPVIFMGRLTKYSIEAVALYLGISLIGG